MIGLLHELTFLLMAALCLDVGHRDIARAMRRLFVGLCVACGIWALGNLCRVHGMVGALDADRIIYLGVLTLPALWLGLSAHVLPLDVARRAPWFPLLLMTPQLGLYALLWSGPWAGLFLVPAPDGGLAPGPLWWINATYSWLQVLAGSGLLLLGAFRMRERGARLRRLGLVFASLVPLGVNVAYVLSGLGWSFDPTNTAVGLALIALRATVFSRGLLECMPISQHDLVGQLAEPVLLIDRQGTIVYANHVAGLQLGLSPGNTLWRGLDQVLLDAGGEQEIELWPIVASGSEVGQIVLLGTTGKRPADTIRRASP
jgi:PAS domain-containing protein